MWKCYMKCNMKCNMKCHAKCHKKSDTNCDTKCNTKCKILTKSSSCFMNILNTLRSCGTPRVAVYHWGTEQQWHWRSGRILYMWNTLGSRFITGTAPGRDLPLWNGTGTPQPLELRFITVEQPRVRIYHCGMEQGHHSPLSRVLSLWNIHGSRFIIADWNSNAWVAFYHCGTPSGCFLQWRWCSGRVLWLASRVLWLVGRVFHIWVAFCTHITKW